jgi:hypothetical protein
MFRGNDKEVMTKNKLKIENTRDQMMMRVKRAGFSTDILDCSAPLSQSRNQHRYLYSTYVNEYDYYYYY